MKGTILVMAGIVVALTLGGLMLLGDKKDIAAEGAKASAPGQASADPKKAPTGSLLPEKLPGEKVKPDAPAKPEIKPSTIAGKSEVPALEGLEFRSAGQDDREKAGAPKMWGQGIVVTSIHPDSPGAEAHLETGDVIVRAQRSDVSSADDLREAAKGRDHVVVTVARGGNTFQVVLQPPFSPK